MSKIEAKKSVRQAFRIRERPQKSLTEEEQISLIANMIIDRILEEAEKGTLPFPVNFKQVD